jgi:cyclopropane fatty-acyl-phospholipid synthase-like methyltransferase
MDEQTLVSLMVDLHRDGMRQGPGGDKETLRALELTRIDRAASLNIADIGCGTGASTLVLASQLPNASITAVDLFPEFLEIVVKQADEAGYANRIETRAESMDSLPFAEEAFDLIWSEGAIYNMGFSNGIKAWRPFLRTGGVLTVSEITWLRPDPPQEILEHWHSEYPEIATAPEKIATLESAGYDLLGYFTLPSSCWIDHYYAPTAQRIPNFLERHTDEPEAAQIAEMERQESDLYRRYQDWFSYGFYVASKRSPEGSPVH